MNSPRKPRSHPIPNLYPEERPQIQQAIPDTTEDLTDNTNTINAILAALRAYGIIEPS